MPKHTSFAESMKQDSFIIQNQSGGAPSEEEDELFASMTNPFG